MSKRNRKRGKAGRQMARAKRAGEEEHILRCLGAAVILQWSDLPRNVQRALFEQAVGMGEPRRTAALKERIARFLHARHTRRGVFNSAPRRFCRAE